MLHKNIYYAFNFTKYISKWLQILVLMVFNLDTTLKHLHCPFKIPFSRHICSHERTSINCINSIDNIILKEKNISAKLLAEVERNIFPI